MTQMGNYQYVHRYLTTLTAMLSINIKLIYFRACVENIVSFQERNLLIKYLHINFNTIY